MIQFIIKNGFEFENFCRKIWGENEHWFQQELADLLCSSDQFDSLR